MRWLPVSARGRREEGERAAARGPSREAAVAGPPAPGKAWVPSPATVGMVPVAGAVRRVRGFWVSGGGGGLGGERGGAGGRLSGAAVAGAVSPEKRGVLVPAMVVMLPVVRLSLRMQWLWVSAM